MQANIEYQYVSLETLAENFSRYGLQITVSDLPDGKRRVVMKHKELASKRLRIEIVFDNGVLHSFRLHALLVDPDQTTGIDHMIDTAKRLIRRHEYHESRKAERP